MIVQKLSGKDLRVEMRNFPKCSINYGHFIFLDRNFSAVGFSFEPKIKQSFSVINSFGILSKSSLTADLILHQLNGWLFRNNWKKV